ncbi:ABC transporter ATP-binding protein [Glycomyces buryatensis]|uniref:ATP-binding cassette domain-containing protein n=1 Tax=Glycomyces buryatensis TaxID=2570927 RepID=A0A4S8Q7F8_9ACTN|nr:ATP-binding cassette domain-containing protein [Glycomyces buryatensis]THV40178.1 ATP-binding cassette domain-containing protein [Glycomyces buryatensis]
MDDNIVSTDRLTKRYGDHPAVDQVSLSVRRGEVYGFLGPNGAGKTTTLRMLLGLVRPTGGTASVHGLAPGSPDALRRTGSLIEGPGFFPYLSGLENLRVIARYRGLGRRDADEALERVELTSRGSDRFRTYSLGMKQRLGVAAALLGRPDLLILDEPTNGLDPAGMASMRSLIQSLSDDGQTVLLSSHLLAEVQQFCHRVGVIVGGKMAYEGTVSELRGSRVLRLHADPIDRAMRVLKGATASGADLADDEDGRPTLTADARGVDIPALIRELVAEDVDVHSVSVNERSLEEVFLTMTEAK